MKLFNKTIDRQLFKQYPLGSDLSKQEVVVKIFNPTGGQSWFIINSDPEDPDYLWAIVDLGYGAEVGSVSRSELENYRGRFGLGFERDLSFDPVNASELFRGVREGKFYADGGDIAEFSDNQRMIMNQNVQLEHHHEELEDVLEDRIEVPAWVVAKMATATQSVSDITHYLDGQKELMEDEEEEDEDDIMEREVVEPINVTAGTKAELTKDFTNQAWNNLRGFLKGMEGIDLRDDYTFDYKDEQFEVEPIINTDDTGVSNAVFSIFDGDGEEVGEVAYSREGGKQKFTANSEFFSWNNAKFEGGGYFDGTIPKVSTYMSTYAKGGDLKENLYPKYVKVWKKDVSKFKEILNKIGVKSPYYEDISDKQFNTKQIAFYFKNEDDRQKAFNHYHEIFADGGGIERKMGLGDPVIYQDELWYVSEKNGIVGLINFKQGAWGSDYPFIPLSRIQISTITDMMGRPVHIPYLVEDFAKGGGLKKYILKADIETVTVKRGGKEVTYKGDDVYNGANMLSGGGDLSSKANYIKRTDVVSVQLKSGESVKPVNGYWVKKGAEPVSGQSTPTSSGKSEPKIGMTRIRKDMRGNWLAETNIDNFDGHDWRLSTIKTYSGKVISSAQGGKTEPTGSKGVSMFTYTMYQDPHHTLEVSQPKRLTEKAVTEQHDKALAKFKKFMETGTFGRGGKISNFDKLSAKVAKQYEGKPVKSQYQEEYGKFYSKEEAREVGDKVAGKVKALQADKKAFGGLFGSAKQLITPSKKYPDLRGKEVILNSGKYVQVFTQNGDKLMVLELGKIGTGETPHEINISEVDPTSYKMGGMTKKGGSNSSRETLIKANVLAKQIRKEGESWIDAKRRAFAQLKNKNE